MESDPASYSPHSGWSPLIHKTSSHPPHFFFITTYNNNALVAHTHSICHRVSRHLFARYPCASLARRLRPRCQNPSGSRGKRKVEGTKEEPRGVPLCCQPKSHQLQARRRSLDRSSPHGSSYTPERSTCRYVVFLTVAQLNGTLSLFIDHVLEAQTVKAALNSINQTFEYVGQLYSQLVPALTILLQNFVHSGPQRAEGGVQRSR